MCLHQFSAQESFREMIRIIRLAHTACLKMPDGQGKTAWHYAGEDVSKLRLLAWACSPLQEIRSPLPVPSLETACYLQLSTADMAALRGWPLEKRV